MDFWVFFDFFVKTEGFFLDFHYFFWKTGTKALAAELGRQKIPHYKKIASVANESREMIWTFLEYFN